MARMSILPIFLLVAFAGSVHAEEAAVRVGWIGAMSGAVAKYGAYQAAILAAEDVNREGGVKGRAFELVFEDGRCSSRDAITAVNKLINVDKIRFVVGGHCSPESIPIAPLAEKAKTVMLAAITSSPKLSHLGDYVFRVTAPNTDGAKLLLSHAKKRGYGKLAVIYEETEYAQGLAEFFRSESEHYGASIALYDGFSPGESDFRSLVTKLRASGAQALYLSPQSPDGSIGLLRAMHEQGLKLPVLGNEIAGNTVKAADQFGALFEGMTFAEPRFDIEAPAVKDFEARYKKRFNVSSLPYGFYTCEAYDAVRVMAFVMNRCGEDPQAVKECLYQLRGYRGLSGDVAFDSNGDGVRHYVLKRIARGIIQEIRE